MNVYIPAITLSHLILALQVTCVFFSLLGFIMWRSYFALRKPRGFPTSEIIATLFIVTGWICFLLATNILPPLP